MYYGGLVQVRYPKKIAYWPLNVGSLLQKSIYCNLSAVSPTRWSSCSLENLAHAFEHGMDYCLRNKPVRSEMEKIFAGECGDLKLIFLWRPIVCSRDQNAATCLWSRARNVTVGCQTDATTPAAILTRAGCTSMQLAPRENAAI